MSTWQRRHYGSSLRTRGFLLQVWHQAGDWHWQVRGMARATSKGQPFDDIGVCDSSEEAEAKAVASALAYLAEEVSALQGAT